MISESESHGRICFKCHGTGLKPVKKKYESFKLPCTVCEPVKQELSYGSGNGIAKEVLVENEQRSSKKQQKSKIRKFKVMNNELGKCQLKPLFNVYQEQDYQYLNNILSLIKNENIMLTALCGDWMIYQFENGHKITTDDCFISALVVRHFYNLKEEKKPKKYLDLGTGLGSVLQLVSWGLELQKHDDSILLGIEAQKVHVDLARRSLYHNNCPASIIHADLREFVQYSQKEWSDCNVEFDLITGTPPYFPIKNGPLPTSYNRALCSFEIRGDVYDYLKAASLLLKKSTDASVFIANGGPIERTIDAGKLVKFQCLSRWDLVGIKGKPVLFSVYLFKWNNELFSNGLSKSHEMCATTIYCRDEHGQFTQEYQDLVCKWIGKPRPGYEPHSRPSHQ